MNAAIALLVFQGVALVWALWSRHEWRKLAKEIVAECDDLSAGRRETREIIAEFVSEMEKMAR